MEGIFIVIKAWGLAAFMIWVHRRFFERVGRREREFEGRFEQGVRLAAFSGDAAGLARVEAALRSLLGKRGRLVATLGGYPWPHYELAVRLARTGRALTLVATRAELARAHARPAPALVTVIRELIAGQGDAIEDHWLAPAVIYRASNDVGSAGYRVGAGLEPRPRVVPCTAAPPWLEQAEGAASAENSAERAAPALTSDAKLLQFSGEC